MKITTKFSSGAESDAFKLANETEKCARVLEAAAEYCVDEIDASPVVVMNVLKTLHAFMEKEFMSAVRDVDAAQKQFKIITPGNEPKELKEPIKFPVPINTCF